MENKVINDLVYLDINKASSIYSQLNGGIIGQIQSIIESTDNLSPNLGFNLNVIKAQLSGSLTEKNSRTEIKTLHHDLLLRLEAELKEAGMLIDVNNFFKEQEISIDSIRDVLVDCNYVKAEGWCTIEDYERLKSIALKFNEVSRFIKECGVSNNASEDVKKMQSIINDTKKRIAVETNPSKKSKDIAKVKKIEEEYSNLLNADTVPDFLVDGIKLVIDTFLPNRINFRVYPFESHPSFQLFANLKRDCFIDTDVENMIFSYGSTPNIKLTIIGLITSIPDKGEYKFDPLGEFETDAQSPEQIFERAFRGVFRGFEGFESFFRYSRYPNVTVMPIAVYRTIRSNHMIATV